MKVMNGVQAVLRCFDAVTHVLNWVGYVSLAGLIMITFVDVTGRYLINKPLQGSLEISELAMAVLGAFALLYTTTQRGHISVDLFFVRFSRRTQKAVNCAGALLGFATWGIISYRVYLLGRHIQETRETSSLLGIPISPFQFVFALGLALFALALLIEAFLPFVSEEPKREEGGLGV